MLYGEVDCEECVYFENEDECLGCVHYDEWFDKFVQITPAQKLERANERKRSFNARIIKEEVLLGLTGEFMKRLKVAWKFVPPVERENFKLYCVYCGQGYLMSSDAFRLIKVYADCPQEFIGRHLLLDDIENNVYLLPSNFSSPFLNGSAQSIIDEAASTAVISCLKSEISLEEVTGDKKRENDVRIKGVCRLNKSYLNDVLDLIPDDEVFQLYYRGAIDAIRIKAKCIDALVLPVRE